MHRRNSVLSLSFMLLAACGGAENPNGGSSFTDPNNPSLAADSGVGTGSTGGSSSGIAGGALSGAAGGAVSGGAGGSLSGTAGGSLSGTSGTTGGGSAGGTVAGATGGTGGSTAGSMGGATAGSTAGAMGGGAMAGGSPGGTGGGYVRGPAPTAEALTKEGPYKVQSTTSGFRDGPNFAEATLWWPTDADPPFASVAVVPGWVSTEADIKEWGPYLASYGIVVLTAGTNSPATDLPPDRAAALLDALETIRAENTRSGGPLNGKLDTARQATMGWSMGGGGTLLAAEMNPNLKATISMCGWNPDYKYSKLTVPALLFASKGDPLAGGQSQPFYESIPDSTPKELWEVDGGDHWFFNTPKNMNGIVGRYGLSWLKVFLEGDSRYMQFLKEMPAMKTDFRNNLK